MIIIVAMATLTTIPAEEKRVARKYKAKYYFLFFFHSVAAQGSGQKRTFHNLLQFMDGSGKQAGSQLKTQMNSKLRHTLIRAMPQRLFRILSHSPAD